MHSSLRYLSVLGLVAYARATAINNQAVASKIAALATSLSGKGSYVFTNAKTGQTLSFVREDVTNVYPQDSVQSMDIQFNSLGQARISGGNNKCISAQWGFQPGEQYDNAAVAYACAVGTGLLTGSATLEEPKQWWYIIPAGTTSSSSSSATTVAVSLVADTSDDGDDDEDTKASSSSSSSNGKYPAGVDPKNRLTWICKHDGAWLAAHPGYTDVHTECIDDLAKYNASTKKLAKRRLSHSEMAAKVKRGQTTYNIIAFDHLLDMETRAIGSDSMSTPGGYTSTELVAWDSSDVSQQWIITSA